MLVGNAVLQSLGTVDGQLLTEATREETAEASEANVPVVGRGTQLVVPVGAAVDLPPEVPVGAAAVPDADAATKGFKLSPPLAAEKSN